jgi:nucleoside-diphosphate-sugar epimerase
MKRVLVTGAGGFVGRHCLPELLERGFEVHASCRRPTRDETPRPVTWHAADLLEPGGPEALVARVRPTHLLHMAWEATPGTYWESPDNLCWLRASLDLLTAFAAAGGERLVSAGTCAEYDWTSGRCCERDTPLAPSTLYGTCKNALRQVEEAFAARQGFSFARARLFFLYGPHEHPRRFVPSVIRPLLAGEPARCTHGRQVRDFLFVADAASALAAVLDSPVTGAVNVASGEPVALRDVAGAVAVLLGRPDLLRLGALPPPPGEAPVIVADVARLAGEVGWSPRRSLEQGLARTVEWWRQRLVPGGAWQRAS